MAFMIDHFQKIGPMTSWILQKPQAVQKGRPARPQRAKRRGVPLGYVEPLSDARTPLADFWDSLLGFRFDTFNIEPYLDLIPDDEPAAIQGLVPDHTEILAVELSLRAEASPGIAPGILRRPVITAH